MQSPSKLCVASVSTQLAVLGLTGWADLPDGLLHSILALSGSFRDVLAFAATCLSWRAAFFSYPSKSNFCTKFPPLLIKFDTRVQASDLPSNNGRHELQACKVIDPTNKKAALRLQIPQEFFREMHFAGTSYGRLIFCRGGYCLVVDVFSGAELSPPRLPFSSDFERESYVNGTLTAPLGSPNSHLLLSTQTFLFDWPVGSDSWSELRTSDARIEQIVEFSGQFIAMDSVHKIYTLQLSPQLGLQQITTESVGNLIPSLNTKPWLVVCGDKLLMVYCFRVCCPLWSGLQCVLHHLDMSTNPAKWVEVKELDKWALFVVGDVRGRPFSCLCPEQWGGRNRWLYYASRYSCSFTVHGVGEERVPYYYDDLVYDRSWSPKLQPLWVYPSMFYSNGQ